MEIEMKKSLLCVIGLFLLFLSCESSKQYLKLDFDYKKFSDERNLWNSSKPNNYQYNFSNEGFGPYLSYTPVNSLIIVENEQFKREERHAEYETPSDYLTIDKIYKAIEDIYKQYNDTMQSETDRYFTKIKIKYDGNYHIPVIIEYYYHFPEDITGLSSYWKYKIDNYRINN
jgi:hypothetical protein